MVNTQSSFIVTKKDASGREVQSTRTIVRDSKGNIVSASDTEIKNKVASNNSSKSEPVITKVESNIKAGEGVYYELGSDGEIKDQIYTRQEQANKIGGEKSYRESLKEATAEVTYTQDGTTQKTKVPLKLNEQAKAELRKEPERYTEARKNEVFENGLRYEKVETTQTYANKPVSEIQPAKKVATSQKAQALAESFTAGLFVTPNQVTKTLGYGDITPQKYANLQLLNRGGFADTRETLEEREKYIPNEQRLNKLVFDVGAGTGAITTPFLLFYGAKGTGKITPTLSRLAPKGNIGLTTGTALTGGLTAIPLTKGVTEGIKGTNLLLSKQARENQQILNTGLDLETAKTQARNVAEAKATSQTGFAGFIKQAGYSTGLIDERTTYQKELVKQLQTQGATTTQINSALEQSKIDLTARQVGRISGLIGASAFGERTGQIFLGTATKSLALQKATAEGEKSFIRGFEITAPRIARAGFVEGSTTSIIEDVTDEKNVNIGKAVFSGASGYASAGLIGGTLAGTTIKKEVLNTALQEGNDKVTKLGLTRIKGAEKTLQTIAYTTDPYEYIGDVTERGVTKVGKKLGYKYNEPEIFLTKQKIPVITFSNTATQTNTKVANNINQQIQVVTDDRIITANVISNINTKINDNTNNNIRTNINLPTNTNLPTNINLPVNINVPVNTNIPINVPTLTPMARYPPLVPLPFEIPRGNTGSGLNARKGKKYINEIQLASSILRDTTSSNNFSSNIDLLKIKKQKKKGGKK